jgi:hypothetical protein
MHSMQKIHAMFVMTAGAALLCASGCAMETDEFAEDDQGVEEEWLADESEEESTAALEESTDAEDDIGTSEEELIVRSVGIGHGIGYPGIGYPGIGYPGIGYPGVGLGVGYPGVGYPGLGYPGVGYPGVGHRWDYGMPGWGW